MNLLEIRITKNIFNGPIENIELMIKINSLYSFVYCADHYNYLSEYKENIYIYRKSDYCVNTIRRIQPLSPPLYYGNWPTY